MVVNVRRSNLYGSGKIKRSENSIIIDKSVSVTVGKRCRHVIIEIKSNNLANVVDCRRRRDTSVSQWCINREEQTGIPKKSMKFSRGVSIITNDLAIIVDADSLGQICAWKIENGAFAFFIPKEPTQFSNHYLEWRYWNLDGVGNDSSQSSNLTVFIERLRLYRNDIFRTSDISRSHFLIKKESIRC